MNSVKRLVQFAIGSQAIKISQNSSRNLSNLVKMSNRVLSIQSHVVHGYCGNKSAVFPLQVSFKSFKKSRDLISVLKVAKF